MGDSYFRVTILGVAAMLLTLPFWIISMIDPGSILGLMLTVQTLAATQLTYFRIYMAILQLVSFIFMAMTLFPALDKGLNNPPTYYSLRRNLSVMLMLLLMTMA